jgi:cytoskeletal protein RodZ
VQSLDDRLRALAEALDDPQPAPKATIERRASQLRRRRRLVQASGALAASVAIVVGAAAALSGDDGAGDVVTGTPPPTTATTTPTTSSTLPPRVTSSSTPPATTTSPPASVMDDPGGLTSATSAIRSACRRFYGSATVEGAPGADTTGTSLLTEPELAGRCDVPQPEFRADCYAARPETFVAGEGGCAVLGGYLAVFYGEPPENPWDGATDPMYRFAVGDDVWWIYPESD